MRKKKGGKKRKEKKMRQKKKGVKKKFQCGNRTRDLLICKRVAIVSPHMRIYDQTSRIYIYIYIANLDCHDLNVSALAPPIIGKAISVFGQEF